MSVKLASFPNSRIKPRPATRDATQFTFSIPSGVATKIADVNPDRTYYLVENLSAAQLRVGYEALNLDTIGFIVPGAPGGVREIESLEEIWVYQNSGAPIDIYTEEGVG